MDLPTYLRTIPDKPVELKDACPECGEHMLVGMYESDTNAVYGVMCRNCDYREDY